MEYTGIVSLPRFFCVRLNLVILNKYEIKLTGLPILLPLLVTEMEIDLDQWDKLEQG